MKKSVAIFFAIACGIASPAFADVKVEFIAYSSNGYSKTTYCYQPERIILRNEAVYFVASCQPEGGLGARIPKQVAEDAGYSLTELQHLIVDYAANNLETMMLSIWAKDTRTVRVKVETPN